MKKNNELLIIIPARGGSKRILNKNMTKVEGKPMISWPILKLKKTFKNSQIIISTDSTKIKNICKKLGVQAPFVRPKYISGDFVGTMEVISHALKWYEKNIKKTKYVLVVYPTAIFLNAKDLKTAFTKIKNNKDCDSVIPVTTYSYPIQRSLKINENGYVKMLYPKHFKTRSQDLKEIFHDVGQFYFYKSEFIRNKKKLTNSKTTAIKLPRYRVIDIDTLEDLIFARKLKKIYK